MRAVIQFTIPPLRPTCVGLYTLYRFINTSTGVSLCCTNHSNGWNKAIGASTSRKFEVLAVVTVKKYLLLGFYAVLTSVRFGGEFCSLGRGILCLEQVLYLNM